VIGIALFDHALWGVNSIQIRRTLEVIWIELVARCLKIVVLDTCEPGRNRRLCGEIPASRARIIAGTVTHGVALGWYVVAPLALRLMAIPSSALFRRQDYGRNESIWRAEGLYRPLRSQHHDDSKYQLRA
jgi:hypothetical protein